MRRAWRCVLLLGLSCSCAGDLKDPERFSFLVNGGSGSVEDAGVGRSVTGGSSNGGAGGSASSRTPPPCVLKIFKDTCATVGCHSNSAQVDLGSPNVENRLIDMNPSTGICKDYKLISIDGSPSLLAKKIMDAPPCGSKMPLVGMLPASDVTCITDWVNAVSKNGGR